MTMLAVFRSRAQTLDYLSALRAAGIAAAAVNTPKEAGVGCGVSAKFADRDFARAQAIFRRRSYSSFAGFMKRVGERYVFC